MSWTTPFEWAFQIAMWGIGLFLVATLVAFLILVLYALVKAFSVAFKNVRGNMEDKKKPNLTPVE
jgi:hypothetical protein